MSERDQALITALHIPVARVADALGKSRQTVNRGLCGKDDYFKVRDLAKALGHWREKNPELYSLARQSICDIFPDIAQAVLTAANANSASAFTTDVAGEYWLVCGDFMGFRTDLSICASQLIALCQSDENQLKLFVNDRDERYAQRWSVKFSPERVQVVKCSTVDLRMMPTTLLRIDLDDRMDLFGVSDFGFTPLSRREASRMRGIVQDTLLNGKHTD